MHRIRHAILLLSVLAFSATACRSTEVPEAVGSGQETHTVSHFYGKTEVPTDPQRVVVLDNEAVLGTALLLDVPIVGFVAQPFNQQALPYFDAEGLAGAENVGFLPPSIERIAALDPDLIVGNSSQVEEGLYPKLQQLAPTVVVEQIYTIPWKEKLRQIAAVFDGTPAVEAGIAEHEARAEEIRRALREQSDVSTVTLANLRALDDIRIYSSAWDSGETLAEVGFTRHPDQRGIETVNLSIERLGELDAGAIVYFVGSTGTDPDEAAQAENAITSNPLWGTLGAVQRGQTFEVDPDHWFTCGTLQAQNLILDDIERIFLESPT